MDDNTPVIATEPVEATAAPVETPEASPTPGQPVSREETLRQAFKDVREGRPTNRGRHAAFQPRQEAGKFAPGPAAVPVPDLAAATTARPEFPRNWKNGEKLKPVWEQAHPELLTAFQQREADFHNGIQQYKQQAEQAASVLNEFKPYEWLLRNENTTPEKAIGPLLQTAAILRTGTPVQKAQQVAAVMQQYGIQPQHVFQLLSGQMRQPAEDPAYNNLAQELQQIKQQLTESQRAQQEQQERRSLNVIQQFASENPHFDAVQEKVLALLQAPGALGDISGMSEKEKLQVAYDAAVRLDPTVWAQVQAAEQSKAQSRTMVKTAKAAAVQVNGSPSGSVKSTTVDTSNRREVLRNAFSNLRN